MQPTTQVAPSTSSPAGHEYSTIGSNVTSQQPRPPMPNPPSQAPPASSPEDEYADVEPMQQPRPPMPIPAAVPAVVQQGTSEYASVPSPSERGFFRRGQQQRHLPEGSSSTDAAAGHIYQNRLGAV